MAQFTLEQSQNRAAERAARAANGTTPKTFATVGFFGSVLENGNRVKYMTKNGDVALIRVNFSSLDQIGTSTYHQLEHAMMGSTEKRYVKIDCLGQGCPLCAAARADEGKGNISKVKERIFVPMLVSYKKADGTFTAAEPVVWDAPANSRQNYASILASKLNDFGDLTKVVFKLTRNGVGLDTSYTIDYIPQFDNDKIVGTDMSAFDNFRIDKHSYWVKSVDEVNQFLSTGAFPEVVKTEETAEVLTTPTKPAYTAPVAPVAPAAPVTPASFSAAEANPFTTPQQAADTEEFSFSF